MSDDRFQRLSEIFERAVAVPPEQRAAVLDAECNGDPQLRAEVESLLGHADRPDVPVITAAGLDALFEEAGLRPRTNGILPDIVGGNHNTPNPPASVASAGFGAPAGTPMPLLTGQYRILRVVGEGGMGIVYEAEQSFPKRRVALKAMRPGMFSRRMLRRFQNEAHILGRLQHPGIAQIYEAGASDPQHPDDAFFVMEFVDGLPLTTWAEQKKLPTRDRLELFAKVCDAVHHAHQRGVIHRDLKPANILVTEAGGTGVPLPKVLDFGVARVTDEAAHGHRPETMHTGAGQLIGTLAYMPPEQISAGTGTGAGAEPDVRSDVYALGVTLYQLLTGKLPLDLADRSIPDAAQIIRESEPSRLGTLDRTYRGDLETIAAKSMDKDRERRYQSAAELAADVRRYLNGEAIAAKRDSAIYVFRKQIKRNKKAVAVGILALFGVIAFAITAAVQARHNSALAATLADQLAVANADRGRLLTVAGTPALGERVLWVEFLQRPDLKEAYWALWEYYSRQPILRSTGGAGIQPGPAALTPDGRIVVRTGREGDMQGWTSDLSTCLWRTAADGEAWQDIEMLPDGRAAIAVGGGGKLAAIDPRTGATLFRSREAGEITAVDISIPESGKVFYTANRDGGIREWSTSDWHVIRHFSREFNGVTCMSVSPSGRDIVIGTRNGAYSVMDAARQVIMGHIPIKSTAAFRPCFSPDGGALFCLTSDAVIHMFKADTWDAAGSWATGDPTTSAISLLPDGVLLSTGKRGVRVWDVPTRNLLATLPGDESSTGRLLAGPEKGTFYTTGVGTAVRLWETTPYNCGHCLEKAGKDWMLAIVPSPDGRWLFACDSGGRIHMWDAQSGALIGSCRGPAKQARSLVWRPNHSQLFAGFLSGELASFTFSESGPVLENSWPAHHADVCGLAFDASGSTLVSAATSGELQLWEPDSHSLIRSISTSQAFFKGVALSPDGRTIAATGRTPGVGLYSAATGELVNSIPDLYQNWRVRYSPDGSLIAAARAKSEIDILDAKTFKLLRTLRGHATTIVDISFDPTGTMIASGSSDNTFRLWDVATGRNLLTVETGAEVSAVAFIPGRRALATCDRFGRAQVWDLSYYDRHIAGNLCYFYHKLSPICPSPPRADLLLDWARRTTGRADFSLDDPTESVPLFPPVMGTPEQSPTVPTPIGDG
jgi:serine/threonine protein kinase/WD40 repeat protein